MDKKITDLPHYQKNLEKLLMLILLLKDYLDFQKLKEYGSASMLTCIQQLPKSMRDLYPHAYQSYLWNKLASIRIKKYGNKLAIGDIVPKNKEILEQLQQDDEDLQNDDGDENNNKNNINKNQNQNNEEQKQEQPKYKGINDMIIL
ncbi:Pseudouridine synthase, catalytic domain [Pseudocohnilembus persalinus]|uniref:Pseudouridine synthase, catalytic domain n=1 Tax=Pseudocohnilembus persalinus TaxID=266149 RepID=A0A0V0QYB5_PSEPJ|nr:Pseudouridine synthase, catalytic domain [Pseudocohnilembus persalinus]|eukprot:KRX07204.1 Pseudouridine synthase, catalytic domain [Pseudocohnilembus persalinus]